MTTNSKRMLFVGWGILLVALALILLGTPGSGGPRYRTESLVLMRPLTNTVFTRSFEARIIKRMPGVLRLWVTPTFSAIPAPGVTVATNGAAIHVIAVGGTAEEAQRVANETAQQLCRIVREDYAATAEIPQLATTARRYSFFHDKLQDGILHSFRR